VDAGSMTDGDDDDVNMDCVHGCRCVCMCVCVCVVQKRLWESMCLYIGLAKTVSLIIIAVTLCIANQLS